jgi:hypothetical protein
MQSADVEQLFIARCLRGRLLLRRRRRRKTTTTTQPTITSEEGKNS